MSQRRLLITGGTIAAVAIVAAIAAIAMVVTGGWGATSAAAPAPGKFGSIHTGPQGSVAQFVVKCAYSHTSPEDPIVHPGMPGMSHSHDFFGNRTTNASSTADSLRGGPTTCNQQLDSAAYWSPTLSDHGVPVVPLGLVAYYRPAPGVDPTSLAPFPAGLMMIAGDSVSDGPQRVEVAAWTCGSSSDLEPAPPDCPPDAPLRMRLTYPDCWNGHDLDSADHHAHVSYSQGGRCPTGYPVAMPQLTVTVRYPVSGPGHELTLASGPTYTVHGDFVNAWDQAELTREVDVCLHRGVVCSVASNRAEDQPQLAGDRG